MTNAIEVLNQADRLLTRVHEASKAETFRQWAAKPGPKNYKAYVDAVGAENAVSQLGYYSYAKNAGVVSDAARKRATSKPLPSRGSAAPQAASPSPEKAAAILDVERWLRALANRGETYLINYARYMRDHAYAVHSKTFPTHSEFEAARRKVQAEQPEKKASVTRPVPAWVQPKKALAGAALVEDIVSSAYPRGDWEVEEGDNPDLLFATARTPDRGPRTDHGGGFDGEGWMSDRQIERLRAPYEVKYGPVIKRIEDDLAAAGYSATGSVDYGEKGHVSLQIWNIKKIK